MAKNKTKVTKWQEATAEWSERGLEEWNQQAAIDWEEKGIDKGNKLSPPTWSELKDEYEMTDKLKEAVATLED